MIPDRFIEELKYRVSIEELISPYTNLKRSGRNLKGLCPFHSEKTPSFMVYPENGSFYCFGCGAGGDIVTFTKLAEHLEYIEALKFLAERAGMTLPEDVRDDETAKLRMRVLECNRETARFFHQCLISPQGAQGLHYLRQRGLSDRTIKRFGLGYSPDSFDSLKNHLAQLGFSKQEMLAAQVVREGRNNSVYDQFRNRVIFPIIDLRGNVIGFGGRIMGEGQPKYLNSPDTLVFKKSRNLFALNRAKATKELRILLTEGYMDAIAVHQAGFDNAVATLGTALTAEQARLLTNYTNEVVIAYDSDEAGRKATARATDVLASVGLKVRVLSMRGAKDPDEYIKKNGAQSFKMLVEGSANSIEYEILLLKQRFDIETEDGKVSFLREFCKKMAELSDKLGADVYITKIASELAIPREAIAEQVKTLRQRNFREKQKKYDKSLAVGGGDRQSYQKDPQRAQNLKYALAEDKLLAALLKNPDYYGDVSQRITPDDFVTDSNREIYISVCGQLSQRQQPSLLHLSQLLNTDQMSRLSGILATTSDLSFTKKEAFEYIATILSHKNEKSDEQIGSMDEQELRRFIGDISIGKK